MDLEKNVYTIGPTFTPLFKLILALVTMAFFYFVPFDVIAHQVMSDPLPEIKVTPSPNMESFVECWVFSSLQSGVVMSLAKAWLGAGVVMFVLTEGRPEAIIALAISVLLTTLCTIMTFMI